MFRIAYTTASTEETQGKIKISKNNLYQLRKVIKQSEAKKRKTRKGIKQTGIETQLVHLVLRFILDRLEDIYLKVPNEFYKLKIIFNVLENFLA